MRRESACKSALDVDTNLFSRPHCLKWCLNVIVAVIMQIFQCVWFQKSLLPALQKVQKERKTKIFVSSLHMGHTIGGVYIVHLYLFMFVYIIYVYSYVYMYRCKYKHTWHIFIIYMYNHIQSFLYMHSSSSSSIRMIPFIIALRETM